MLEVVAHLSHKVPFTAEHTERLAVASEAMGDASEVSMTVLNW